MYNTRSTLVDTYILDGDFVKTVREFSEIPSKTVITVINYHNESRVRKHGFVLYNETIRKVFKCNHL